MREAGLGYGRGFDDVIWVRGQGYDPLIVPGDPRAKHVESERRARPAPPPEDDPDRELWKKRWEQYLRNRAVLAAAGDENRRRHAHGQARRSNGSSAAGAKSEPFLLWLDLFSPHGPWDPPQPFREQYVTVEPDEFETGEEGELVEDLAEESADEIDIEDVAT